MVTPAEIVAKGAYFVCVDADWGEYAVLTAAAQNVRAWRERVYAALRSGWRPPAERVLPRWPAGARSAPVVEPPGIAPSPKDESPKDEVASWT